MVCLLLTGCRSLLPWGREPKTPEANLAFVLEQNLIRLPSVEINGRSGRYFLATAHARTAMDPSFQGSLQARRVRMNLSEKRSLPLTPVPIDLRGTADAFIGAEPWSHHAITVDYRVGLVTYQEQGIYPDYMVLYPFAAEPAITVLVNGRSIPAVVDTALPDSLVLPRGTSPPGRTTARVEIAGSVFPSIDVALDDVTRARVGNRLLSRFLVTIDYGRRQVGLWRDPRIPLE